MSQLLRAGAMAAVSLMVSATAAADELDLGVNDNVVSTSLTSQIGDHVNGSLGYIFSDDRGHLAQVGASMTHDAGVHHLEFGANLGHLWANHLPDAAFISLGGKYGLDLGSHLSFHADAYYTPKVLAFSHLDGHYQLGSAIQYDLTPQMGFYAGYRYIRFEYDGGVDRTFDSGFYVGMKARF